MTNPPNNPAPRLPHVPLATATAPATHHKLYSVAQPNKLPPSDPLRGHQKPPGFGKPVDTSHWVDEATAILLFAEGPDAVEECRRAAAANRRHHLGNTATTGESPLAGHDGPSTPPTPPTAKPIPTK